MMKFFTLYITPLIAICVICLRAPVVERFLTSISPEAPLYALGTLVFLTILNHVFTVYSPFTKFEKIAKHKWGILDFIAKSIVSKYENRGINVRLNIMTAEYTLFHLLHPRKHGSSRRAMTLFGKRFKVIWSYGNEKVDKKLSLSTKQGVCGKAYTHGKVFGKSAPWDYQDLNFNDTQRTITQKLVMVTSCPIFEYTEKTDAQGDSIIGVLNIESDTPNSGSLIGDDLANELIALSNVLNKVL